MNEAYNMTQSTFAMFPWLTSAQWATIRIAAGSIALALFAFKVSTGQNYEKKTMPERIISQDFSKY